MPTNIRAVYVQQRNNLILEYKCDYRYQFVPELLPKPDENDYLTDEESDEAGDFELKMPELDQLIEQFENDENLNKREEQIKTHFRDENKRGFEPEVRYDIVNNRADKNKVLDDNISKQRVKQVTHLTGMVSDLNEKTKKQKNKMFLR